MQRRGLFFSTADVEKAVGRILPTASIFSLLPDLFLSKYAGRGIGAAVAVWAL